jgi:DNA-directed RNA polymerase subunit RPC12/RpoP
MDPTVDPVEILCPRCGEGFSAWEVTAADRADAGTPLLEQGVRCPHCGGRVPLEAATLHDGGLLQTLH